MNLDVGRGHRDPTAVGLVAHVHVQYMPALAQNESEFAEQPR